MFEQVKQEIDDKIKTNGNNEITATRLNGVLQDMMDAAAEEIEDVAQSVGTEVEANPTGEATTPLNKIKIGEAIYKTGNPFAGEVDATDAERLQALANVSNQTANSTTGKMGYVVLQPGKDGDATTTFAAQIANKPNTIFEIRDVFDLGGTQDNPVSVTIPANCTLKFNGGVVSNGTITGTHTMIDGKPLFKEITFSGSFICNHVSSKDFEYSTDDEALTAVFQFLNCIKKDVICELETKTYNIDYKSSIDGNTLFSKWKLDNCSNITINGNDAILNHTNPLTDIPAGFAQLNSILKLNDCSYITIRELTYQNLNGYATNYQGDCDGICVIFFEGNNSFLDISMTVKNARSALGNHIYSTVNTNHIGLVNNSVFNVKQYHTGYGVTFSWIANSKINVESHGQHRGVYLTGASNCDVYLEWEDQWTAPIACLIGNSWTGGSDNLVWHTCRDLNIVSICTQETANADDATVEKYCAGLGSTEEPRTIGLTMQNITITTGSLHGISNGFISVLSTSPSTDTTVKDYYKNFIFTINNIDSRFEFHDNRVIQDFAIVNSRFSGVIFANFIKSSKLIFRNSYVNKARIGKGTYNFINTNIAELMDYNSLSSKTDTIIYFDNCFITSTSNLTIKATIRSSMLPYNPTYFWPFSVLCSSANCDVSRVMMPNFRDNALNYGNLLIQTTNHGLSTARPADQAKVIGVSFFDETLGRPIWWDGSKWIDATGAVASALINYTISTNIDSNITIDNSETSIEADKSYIATLTADDSYSIDSVTVTIGGINVTSFVYNLSTGVIYIARVTGNVEITATATQNP